MIAKKCEQKTATQTLTTNAHELIVEGVDGRLIGRLLAQAGQLRLEGRVKEKGRRPPLLQLLIDTSTL